MSMPSAQAPASSRHTVFKGALQGTVLYSIPLVGQRVASILLLAIVTRVLTKDDFGMLSLLEQVSSVLSLLLGGAFSGALGYFYFQRNGERDRSEAVGTAVGGSFLLGGIAGLVCWLARVRLARDVFRSEEALRYLPLVCVAIFFGFGMEALFGWLRIEDRQAPYAKISLLRIGLTATGIVVLVGVLRMHVMAYVSTTAATMLAITVILVIYLFRVMRPAVSISLFLRMFRFSMPLGLGMIAMFVINFGDQFVLRHYRSLGEVGIYALAYRIGMIVAVVYSAFHSYWNAQVYRILQMEDADRVFARLLTYVLLLLAAVTLLLTLTAEPGLRILVGKDFRAAAPLIPVLAAANAIRSVGEFMRCRFLAAGKPGYEAYCNWIGMAICVALYFLLIPRFGMWGGAIATIATFLVMTAISVLWTYRMGRYRVEGERLLKMGGVVATILILYYAVPVSSLVLQICWSVLLLALLPAGLWLLRFPTEGEWQGLRSIAQKVTSRQFS